MDNLKNGGNAEKNLTKTDNLTQNGQATAEAAEAEREEAAAELGKFKSVETLLKAYSELEAEFTRRSQKLRELELKSKAETVPDGDTAKPSLSDEEEFVKNAVSNEKVRDAVIGDYLKSVLKKFTPFDAWRRRCVCATHCA